MTERSDAGETACPYRRTGEDPERGIRKLERLTDREQEVLLLLGTGLANRQLARELGIAERTVKAHVARIVEKLRLETRVQAVVVSVLSHARLCTDPLCSRHLPGILAQSRRAMSAA
ncbi:response regulator transcription factor [Streptomyces sp. NPDC059008]|uniref:response regulator transcription factor n=1 Tax=unclassified Streptomyces TaxID=2593676 RepID=UPI0036C6EFCB